MAKEREIDITGDEDELERAEQSAEGSADAAAEAGEEQAGSEPTDAPVETDVDEKQELERKVAELEDKLMYALAEQDNYRKRSARQTEEMMRAAREQVIVELLEVVDNFERALQHADEAPDAKSLRQGMDMIYGQLKAMLDKHNVAPIEATGKPFDPRYHEALMQVPSEDYGEGMVAVEMSKGYVIGDRVIRHSKVGVSTGKPGSGDGGDA